MRLILTNMLLATLAWAGLPAGFEALPGQGVVSRAPRRSLLLTSSEARLEDERGTLRMRWIGGRPSSAPTLLDPLPGKSHYFTGSDPSRWRTNVAQFAQVKYEQVYPGIDLVFYGNHREIEYDFVVAPGADPRMIRFAFPGARRVRIGGDGDLDIELERGSVKQRRPRVYQGAEAVAGRYVWRGKDALGFDVGRYDRARPLVIDPVIAWGAYLGGLGADSATGIAIDAIGNIYVTGQTASSDFPAQLPRQGAFAGGSSDAFVTKISPDGRSLIYSTFLGGNNTDVGSAIAVDAAGNAYLTGSTASNDFPILTGAFQPQRRGNLEAFVAKLNPDGSQLLYSTFLSGANNDAGHGIALDAGGNAYVAGITNSPDFPVSPGAYDATFNGGDSDLFLFKLGPGGNTRVFATYLGGSGNDQGNLVRVALNGAGNAFLGGYTTSTDFPTTGNAVQRRYAGMFDGVVARFSADGSRLEYSTYLGGSRNDGVYGIALDAFDNLYLSGSSGSPDFPTAPGTPQAMDGFVARLVFGPGEASALRWVRLFGNEANTIAYGLGVLGPSLVVVGGTRGSALAMRTPGQAAGVEQGTPPPAKPFSGRFDLRAGHNLEKPQFTGDDSESNNVAVSPDFLAWIGHGPGSIVLGGSSTAQKPGGPDVNILKSGPNRVSFGNGRSGTALDPVATATGERFDLETDLDLGGPLPLTFRRYYGSLLGQSGIGGALGANWMHNFDLHVAATPSVATVALFAGHAVRFQRSGAGWQVLDLEPANYQLATLADGYRFLDPEDGLVCHFDTAGWLTRIEDRNGNALNVTPGPLGPLQVTDGLGRSLTFRYQGLQLIEVADQTGRRVQFQQSGGNLTRVTDPNGKTYQYAYAAGGQVGLITETTLPAGNKPITSFYDSQDRVARQTDSRGNSANLEYDRPSAGITTLTDPLARVARHTHQNGRDLTLHIDAAGQGASYAYDPNRRPTGFTDRRGNRTSASYDSFGNLTALTDPDGKITRFSYTPQTQGLFTFHNLTALEPADGTSLRFAYDGAGNPTTLTDRAGKSWTYTYNSRGQELTARNPAGGATTHTYNADGSRSSTTFASGDTIRYEYDPLKRPVRILWPDGTSRRWIYDGRDQVLLATDERDKATRLTYNDNGRLAGRTDALNASASFAYDGDERLSSFTDRLGKITRVAYDAVGEWQRVTNPVGETLTVTRDPVGRVTQVADAAGPLTSLTRDGEGEVTGITDALANRWSISRDALGRVTQMTEPAGGVQRFSYDAVGRTILAVNPLGERTEIAYDPHDFPARITMPGQVTASFEYTDLGEIARLTDPNGGNWSRTYDNQGRPLSTSDPLNRQISQTYDNRQRPQRSSFPDGSAENTYDAAGNLVRRQYSDGTDVRYTYDDSNRLTGGAGFALGYDAEDRITDSNGLVIGRDDAGRIASITYAAGKTVTYTRNNRGLVTRAADWLGGITELAYDANRRLTSIRRPNGVTTQFSYDANGRTARIAESGGGVGASIALTRDAAGRVTAAERNLPRVADPAAGSEQFAYDAAHQETGTAAYDRLGRLTSAGGSTYTWDLASRLTALRPAQGPQNFSYDALGMLVAGRHNYVWNYALSLPSIAVFRRVQADLRYFVHLPDGMLLYAIDAADNQRRFYHFDEAGNTVFLTGDNGTITDSYGLTPYGEVVSRSGSTDNPFVFQGQYGVLQVEDTSLYFLRARFYDAANARFLTRDPVQSLDPRSINPYPYAWGDPLRYIDPVGLGSKLRDGGLPRGLFGGRPTVSQRDRKFFFRSYEPFLVLTDPPRREWYNYNPRPDKPLPRGSYAGDEVPAKLFGGGPTVSQRDRKFFFRSYDPSLVLADPPPNPVANGPLPIVIFQNPSGLFGAGDR